MSESLTITWALSTVSGYGIYGLQIVLQLLRRNAQQILLTHKPGPIILPPLIQTRVEPILKLGTKIAEKMEELPEEKLAFRHPVLHAAGNDFAGFAGQDRVSGQPNIGCAAIEHKVCSANAREIAQGYSKLIAISKWNETFLKQLDIAPVSLCYQGIDTDIFYPGPGLGLWRNRFVIFSGGKFEFRKGQDIVVAAFKQFQIKHPEALLVTCWQNRLPLDPAPFALAGHCSTTPEMTELGLHLAPWLLTQGLPPESFLCLPYTPNLFMPATLRECDMAVFPNRCEGGTNLVAMEAMACGVPTFVSNNTGQKDLVELFDCGAFNTQTPVKSLPDMLNVEDWGETDVDEVIAAMEKTYENRVESKKLALETARKVAAFDWAPLNDKLLDVIFDK